MEHETDIKLWSGSQSAAPLLSAANVAIQLVVIFVGISGCSRPATAPAVTGPSSGNGWEIRYTATIALARRGSDGFTDPHVQEIMLEMLDEDQQIRNSRQTVKGREVVDLSGAYGTVHGALDALAVFSERQPKSDLSAYRSAIEKLSESKNPSLAKKAKAVREKLFP